MTVKWPSAPPGAYDGAQSATPSSTGYSMVSSRYGRGWAPPRYRSPCMAMTSE
ncbi:MAG: hypothetical protein QM767_29080 [Anaeromyxobacter sp.]